MCVCGAYARARVRARVHGRGAWRVWGVGRGQAASGHGACGQAASGKRQVGMGAWGGGLVFLCIATCIARLPAFSAQQQTANEEVREGGAQGPAEKFAWV